MVQEEKLRFRGQGRKQLPPLERKVKVYGYVRAKYYNRAQKEIDEILKKYFK